MIIFVAEKTFIKMIENKKINYLYISQITETFQIEDQFINFKHFSFSFRFFEKGNFIFFSINKKRTFLMDKHCREHN